MNSYLAYKYENNIKDYSKKTTYFPDNSNVKLFSEIYDSLPEEYNVFSQIDPSFFTRRETKQYQLMSDCLIYLRSALLSFYMSNGIVCTLPKLSVSFDDITTTFNWAYSTYRAFLSFDNEKGDFDSYCGIVYQSETDYVSTHMRRINNLNYKRVIDVLLDFVINNS